MSYIYLASPYSHPNAAVMHIRYLAARDALAWLLKRGIWTYSPIVHCHELACHHTLPRGFAFWRPYNHAMLKAACGLYILNIPGASESQGIEDELKLAEKLHLPVTFLKPRGDADYALTPPPQPHILELHTP